MDVVGLDRDVRLIMLVREVRLEVVLPLIERCINIDITFRARNKARGTENLQPFVQVDTELAEVLVMFVAEAKYGVPQGLELGGGVRKDLIMEGLGIVRWIAFAIGAGQQKCVLLLRQIRKV